MAKPRKRPRKSDNRRRIRAAFLRAIARGYSLRAAAGLAGVARDTIYEWCRTDAEFSKAFKLAKDRGCAAMEACILRERGGARWLYERRRPRKEAQAGTPSVQVTVDARTVQAMSVDEARAELAKELERAQALLGTSEP